MTVALCKHYLPLCPLEVCRDLACKNEALCHDVSRYISSVLQVSVIYDIPLKELRLFTDYGRTSRPLYIVHDQQLLIKRGHITKLGDESDNYNWQNLVVDGLVE